MNDLANMPAHAARTWQECNHVLHHSNWRFVVDFERNALAVSRGWRISRRHFTVGQLAVGRMTYNPGDFSHDSRVIDHAECFVTWRGDGKRTPQSCRYPAAILSHTYGGWEPCVEFAGKHGLKVERLAWSWYYPGKSIAALFTRASDAA